MSKEPTINWDEVVKKEARGKNEEDLGEVQEIGDTYALVQKGLMHNLISFFEMLVHHRNAFEP
jgi:hypothetical protein